jgi:hypothetical protein
MPETYVTKLQVRVLWSKAQRVGFTKQGLRAMLTLVGINPKAIPVQQYDTLLMYVNAVNAKKFS